MPDVGGVCLPAGAVWPADPCVVHYPPAASALMTVGYELVTLANGVVSVRSLACGETFHPVIGPAAEAEVLYVRQLRLREQRRHA